MCIEDKIKELISTSKLAQQEFENYDQNKVDKCVKAIGKIIYDNAEVLSIEAHEETGFGSVESKIKKHTGITSVMWHYLKNKKSVGIIEENNTERVITLAKPMGVVGSVTPSTNPTTTAVHNAMIALKGRNSIIIAPHPNAKKCSIHAVELMQDALEKVGAPKGLVTVIPEPSIDMTNTLMKYVDVVVATGGPGMVKAAYSSGKPSFGVGQGNVQCYLDKTTNIDEAADIIVTNRSADLGLPCTGEQTVYIAKENKDDVLKSFEKSGAFVIDNEAMIEIIRKSIFKDGKQNLDLVGKRPAEAIELMGLDLEIPENTKVLLVKVDANGQSEPLAKEILWPIIRYREYDDFREAVEWGRENLLLEGAGHTATIHSKNEENIVLLGNRLPVGRVVVNQGGGAGSGARFNNGLVPTISLGCGSWGNNIISENLDYTHLMNVTKVSKVIEDIKIPKPDQIWEDGE